MHTRQPARHAYHALLQAGERGTALLLDMSSGEGSLRKEIRAIRKALVALTRWSARATVALVGEVLGYVRVHRRGLALFALLCGSIMTDRDTPIAASGSSRVTRVMIVDDHPLLRRGLRAALMSFPDFDVVGEAGSGEEALRLVEQVRPQLVLMDLLMPGMGGVPAIRAIRQIAPEAKIMVVTTYEGGDLMQEALQAGAIGYQLKGMEIDELVKAIRQVVQGNPSISPAAALWLVQTASKTPKLGDDLTEREREVLNLLAQGLSNAAIAEKTVVTVATVKFHLRSIRAKLGTKTRTETVAVAINNHLISVPR